MFFLKNKVFNSFYIFWLCINGYSTINSRKI